MLAIASEAGASKETLYSHFGDKAGLFAALVRHNATAINEELQAALADDALPPSQVLYRFGCGLLRLLLGEQAVAINRAAIAEATSTPELGQILTAAGRDTTGPLFVAYLEAQRSRGLLTFHSADEALGVFLGLLLRDRQVRRLLGVEPPPTDADVDAHARQAVSYFLRLFGASATTVD